MIGNIFCLFSIIRLYMLQKNILRDQAKVFSASYLIDLMNGRRLDHFKDIYQTANINNHHDNTSIKSILNSYYSSLLESYQNEYVYKNKLIKSIKSNEQTNRFSLITEIDVGADSRVDMALFSSSSHAFEIKTEFDSLNRLDKQLQDYSKAFEFVWAVTSENKVENLARRLESSIGIQYMNSDNELMIFRNAESNIDKITHEGLFTLLRQKEFIQLLKIHYGAVYYDGTFESRKKLFEMFKEILSHEAHTYTVNLLKNRVKHYKLSSIWNSLPESLFTIGLNTNIQKETTRFLKFLDSRIDQLNDHIHMMHHGKLF